MISGSVQLTIHTNPHDYPISSGRWGPSSSLLPLCHKLTAAILPNIHSGHPPSCPSPYPSHSPLLLLFPLPSPLPLPTYTLPGSVTGSNHLFPALTSIGLQAMNPNKHQALSVYVINNLVRLKASPGQRLCPLPKSFNTQPGVHTEST